jgi:hypothetical protein
MKYAELKLMCSELQLDVRGRAKAPFQAALYAWIDEHGTAAGVVQPAQAALKVWCRNHRKASTHAAASAMRVELLRQPLYWQCCIGIGFMHIDAMTALVHCVAQLRPAVIATAPNVECT